MVLSWSWKSSLGARHRNQFVELVMERDLGETFQIQTTSSEKRKLRNFQNQNYVFWQATSDHA